MEPEVSIIVPVYNGEKNIAECIESLLNLDYPREKLEIIIVDNNSKDRTKEIIEKYEVKYLFEARRGQFYARNTGIENSKGELLAFTDSDCVVDKNWLKYLVRNFTHEEIGGVGGKVVAYKPASIVEKYSAMFVLNQENNINEKMPYIITANAAYRRSVFEDVGLFDGAQFSGGDVDMGWRVVWGGYKLVYEPNAIVYHKHRTSLFHSLFQLFKQFFRYGVWHTRLFKKHREKLGKRYEIDLYTYRVILSNLFLRLPWRLLTFYNKEEKALYVAIPICKATELIGSKLGLIIGSIKNKVVCI